MEINFAALCVCVCVCGTLLNCWGLPSPFKFFGSRNIGNVICVISGFCHGINEVFSGMWMQHNVVICVDMYMSYGWGSPGETWRQTVTRCDVRPSHDVTSDCHMTWRQTVTRILRIRQRAYRNTIKKTVRHTGVWGEGGSLRLMADESAWIIHRTAFNPTPASSAPSK